jgi:hypothetical protein
MTGSSFFFLCNLTWTRITLDLPVCIKNNYFYRNRIILRGIYELSAAEMLKNTTLKKKNLYIFCRLDTTWQRNNSENTMDRIITNRNVNYINHYCCHIPIQIMKDIHVLLCIKTIRIPHKSRPEDCNHFQVQICMERALWDVKLFLTSYFCTSPIRYKIQNVGFSLMLTVSCSHFTVHNKPTSQL